MIGSLMKMMMLVTVATTLSIAAMSQMFELDLGSGNEWKIETVDSFGRVGRFPSLALDENNYPHIGYQDLSNLNPKYARWNGSGWEIETVDSNGVISSRISLALDSCGYPHMVYGVRNVDRDEIDLRYAEWNESLWSIQTVDTFRNLTAPSLDLDGSDYPHISYSVQPGLAPEHLKYAWWDGSTWNIEIVDSRGYPGGFTSLALDSKGYPHIAYRGWSDFDLKYAHWNGSAWEIEIVDSYGNTGWHPSLALDSKDYPHISYQDSSSGDLKYAFWNGSAWSIETVDTVSPFYAHASLALDSRQYPHISYHDSSKGILKYARWDGITWRIEIVDNVGRFHGDNSLDIDDNDYPHIAYYDSINRDLKYATKARLRPPPRQINLDIDPNTLNLKSKGRWITAYLTVENASIEDINISSILLQDSLKPERWDYQGDVLMLKFNRQEFKNTVVVGDSIQIKISGKWKDGSLFEAFDYIRVISQGKN